MAHVRGRPAPERSALVGCGAKKPDAAQTVSALTSAQYDSTFTRHQGACGLNQSGIEAHLSSSYED
eukprot:3055625-Amphidinium_carterae.1